MNTVTKLQGTYSLYDYEDVIFAKDGDGYFPLTDCCETTGKGSDCESGVVCRGCYEEYPTAWGAYFTKAEFERMQTA